MELKIGPHRIRDNTITINMDDWIGMQITRVFGWLLLAKGYKEAATMIFDKVGGFDG